VESPETRALRRLLARYLAGEEALDRVVPELTRLIGRHLETHGAALKQDLPSLADFQPALVTAEDRRRMLLLWDALLDSLPPLPMRYLSRDESSDGTA
jgi:hypothetical protein